MANTHPYPLLTILLAERGLSLARGDLQQIALVTPDLQPAIDCALELLGALEGNALPRRTALRPAPAPVLTQHVVVPEGARRLLGELAYLALEMGRLSDAYLIFGTLCCLAPEHIAGQVGRAQVLLEAGRPEEALLEARAALSIDPQGPEAVAVMAESLLFLGRSREARRILGRAPRPMGASASWLRLLRLGLDEGWLARGVEACS